MKEEEKKKTKNAKYYKRQLRLSLKFATISIFVALISYLLACIGLDNEMVHTTRMATTTLGASTLFAIFETATAIYELVRMKQLEKKEKAKKENNDSKNN